MPLLRLLRLLPFVAIALLALPQHSHAQVRERPIAFDSAGRLTTITPPLAARLGLNAPLWPASGDYMDVRLYVVDDSTGMFILVVRRPHEVLERFALTAAGRLAIAQAVNAGTPISRAGTNSDFDGVAVSEPARGSFVVNQTLLGALLFGPAAAAMIDDGASSAAAYLAVTGASFFLAANTSRSSAISSAQNHLSWQSARRGTIAADLLVYSFTGSDPGGQSYAVAALAGGIIGDIIGFSAAAPMTDAEAHGASHGSTVTAALTAGLLGMDSIFKDTHSHRLPASLVVAAGIAGYPLGLHYVRNASYRVTAGDMGTLVTSEFIGMAAASALISEGRASQTAVYGLLTAGFALGAVAGDRAFVRPFDHTESESRVLQYGALAGALVAEVVPVLTKHTGSHLIYGAGAVGGLLGAVFTEQLIEPQRANQPAQTGRVGLINAVPRVTMRFTPESIVFAGLGLRGQHSVMAFTF